MNLKPHIFSLSGVVTIVYFCLLLIAAIADKLIADKDGVVGPEVNPILVNAIGCLWVILAFPFAILLELSSVDTGYPTLNFLVYLVAFVMNGMVYGYVINRLVQTIRRRHLKKPSED